MQIIYQLWLNMKLKVVYIKKHGSWERNMSDYWNTSQLNTKTIPSKSLYDLQLQVYCVKFYIYRKSLHRTCWAMYFAL